MGDKFSWVVGRVSRPAVIVHGGAGSYLKTTSLSQRRARGQRLLEVAQLGLDALGRQGGVEGILAATMAMEADLSFNAGRGSKLQRDGRVRVTAAVMDGARTRSSSVFNVEGCLHPCQLAAALQERGDRNLDGLGGGLLMKELGVAPVDLRTEKTTARWKSLLRTGDTVDPEAAIGDTGRQDLDKAREASIPVPEDLTPLAAEDEGVDGEGALPSPLERYGTVGALSVSADGALWACTSTGGRGHETPGRISDSGMTAGNYACPRVAVSATGFGEQIIDVNVGGRIAARVLDGASLEAALRRTFAEVAQLGGLLGVIALTDDGQVGYAHTTEACGVAWASADGHLHVDRHGR